MVFLTEPGKKLILSHLNKAAKFVSEIGNLAAARLFKMLLFAGYLLLITSEIHGQTGPGGVGNSSSNRLWLKADMGVYSDAGITFASSGDQIQQWNDYSGNGFNAVQSNASYKPLYQTGIVNGEAAIQFTGNKFIDPAALGISGTEGFSIISVFKVNTGYSVGGISDGSGDYIIDRASLTNNLTSLKFVTGNKYCFQKRDNVNFGIATSPESTSSISTTSFTVINYMRELPRAFYRLFVNGTLEKSQADGDGDLTLPNLRIGRHYNSADGGLNGYITEVLVYNYRINNAQVNIINSYLAAKYDLTINASANKYDYRSTNKNEVAGIGREDANNFHSDAMSGGILEILNPSNLSDGDYLLFGHDKASISSWSTTETPSSAIGKLPREWRVDETGDVGTVTVKFDISTLPAPPGSCIKYLLLVDGDGNFNSGATTYDLTLNGGYYERTGININNGDYITIGIRLGPSVNITPDPAQMCVGGTLNMNGNPSGGSGVYTSHAWTGDTSPLSSTNIQNPNFSTITANVYNLTYTVIDNNGCASSDNIIVLVESAPVAPGLTKLPDETSLCAGATLTVSGTPGSGGTGTIVDEYRYSINNGTSWSVWSTSVPSFSGVVGTNIIESRRTASGNNCNTSPPNSVSWTVVSDPLITTPPVGASVCYNSTHTMSVVVDGGINLSYQWQVSPNGIDTWSDVGTNNNTYTTPGITSQRYYKVIITSNGSGCTASVESNVVEVSLDAINPTISCSGQVVTTTSADAAGNCTTTATLGTPTTGDNCSVSGVIAQVGGATINPATYLFPIGSTTVTWIVTDGSGRTASCTQTVTVTDDENPTISCLGPVVTTTSSDGTGNCTTTATLGTPTTGDNCSVSGVIAQVGGATINPATYLFPIGSTTVTWIVTDGSGRTASCTQTVTVTDNENPTISCLGPVVTTTSSDGTGNCTTTATLGTPTTGDNCSVSGVIAQVGGATINPATYLFPIGSTTVTWIVTDGSGRTASCTQTVTVTDNENPTISCLGPVVTTTSSDGTGNCTTTATLGTPTTGDNCSVSGVIAQVGGATINPATYLFPIGSTTVTWIVTDGSGRTASCTQTVTVTDNENPTISCLGPVVTTTSSDGTGNCTTTATLGTPTTGDNCSVSGVIAQVGGATINPATYLFPIGSTTVTWIVTDGSGRTASCTQTVTVTDNENPTISCLGPVVTTTSSDGAGNCTTTATLGTPTTGDNCSVSGVIAQVGGATINPATYLFPIGSTTVTWIVTDGSGRTASCTQTVTVTDNENPTISCLGPVVTTTSSDGAGNCTTTATLGTPTTGDNCSVSGVIAQVGGATINPATYLFPIGSTTVTWIVTDGSGRTASCTQTVTVTDDENPTISCLGPVVTTTSSDGTGNCTTTATLGTPTTGDNCSVSGVIAQVGGATINPATYLFPIGSTTVTWIVTDGSGRTASCTQTVTVTDNENPTISCLGPVVTTTSSDGTGNCTTTATLGTPTTGDNCSVSGVIAQVGGATINPATYLFPIGSTTVTWIVTDGSGRTASCTQTVTVTDNENPTISCLGPVVTTTSSDGAGNCTTTATLGTPTTGDNCSVSGVIAQVGGATINPATYLFPIGSTTVTWIVTDGSGRTASCTQTVTVTDNENPTISCLGPVVTTTSSDGAGNCTTTATLGTPTTGDNCSVSGVIAQVGGATINPATYLFPIGSTTVTWIVTDGSGRTASCTQTVTVTDNENPTISCLGPVVTTTSSDGSRQLHYDGNTGHPHDRR